MVTPSYLLDTNVLSELRKGTKADQQVCAWFAHKEETSLFTSVICMMELQVGIYRALRKDPDFGILLQDWYSKKLRPALASRVLPVELTTAEECAVLQNHRTLPFRDGLIAATATQRSFVLVTRNMSDFCDLGIEVVNPWVAVT